MAPKVTEFQTRVYTLLQQIPAGKVSTYGALAKALNSSPRAVGGALRNNPFAPEVPCHRIIATDGFIGGYNGDWRDVPSGQNCDRKHQLLTDEGVSFNEKGKLIDKSCWWSDFKA